VKILYNLLIFLLQRSISDLFRTLLRSQEFGFKKETPAEEHSLCWTPLLIYIHRGLTLYVIQSPLFTWYYLYTRDSKSFMKLMIISSLFLV